MRASIDMDGGDARRALVAGLYAAVITGSFYGFSVYSVSLKHQCGLSQTQVVNINTLPYLLGVCSTLVGVLTRPLGARCVIILGCVIAAAGLTSQYAFATHCSSSPAFRRAAPVVLVIFSCITYLGNICATGAAFPVPVQFWPGNRSQVTATVKSFVGLGGAVVAQCFRIAFGAPSASATALYCMLLWAGVCFGCGLMATLVMPPPKRTRAAATMTSHGAEPRRALTVCFVEIAILGLVATAAPLAPDGPVHTGLVLGMLVLVLLPIPIVFLVGRRASAARTAAADGVDAIAAACAAATDTAGATAAATDVCAGSGAIAVTPAGSSSRPLVPPAATPLLSQHAACAPPAESSRQHTLCEMVRTADAWLLWLVGVIVIGSGGLLATNLAFIIEAARAPAAVVTSAATTFATGNLLGRLLLPGCAEAVLVRRGHARPWLLPPVTLLAGLSQLALLWAGSGALPAGGTGQHALLVGGAATGGVAFGAMWPMLVILASELFGREHLVINYLFYDGACGSVGTVLLANVLPSLIYQHAGRPTAAAAAATAPDLAIISDEAVAAATCLGPRCFALTHIVVAGLCAVACCAATALALRSAPLYRRA